ncbi:MAG: phage GP46 family protein [Caulobacteraceae bacterium]
MTDIALKITDDGDFAADIFMAGADLAGDDGMRTAVVISLFTDARAGDDDVLPQPGGDRRGWWGDTYAEIPGDVTGSKLWLLDREKQLPSVLSRAQEYAGAALAWLVDDGVASAVKVVASFPVRGWLGLSVTVERPSGQARQQFDFTWAHS